MLSNSMGVEKSLSSLIVSQAINLVTRHSESWGELELIAEAIWAQIPF